jgi:hypothetical protein
MFREDVDSFLVYFGERREEKYKIKIVHYINTSQKSMNKKTKKQKT